MPRKILVCVKMKTMNKTQSLPSDIYLGQKNSVKSEAQRTVAILRQTSLNLPSGSLPPLLRPNLHRPQLASELMI